MLQLLYFCLLFCAGSLNASQAEYTSDDVGSCSMEVGKADSYILAVSHQPGFCQTYGYEAGKLECIYLNAHSYQANHLTLHGLWPNQDLCGQHYGFCGSIKPKAHHCDYAPLPLTPIVAQDLKKIMPSYFYGSCLERHEWNKHGSCQILSPDEYFSLAMRLVQEVDQSAFGHYLTEHKGTVVPLSTLRSVIVHSFGKNNAGKIYLGCKNGVLVDIYIKLPALIPIYEPLNSLLATAPVSSNRDSCGSKVTISDFNKESLFW